MWFWRFSLLHPLFILGGAERKIVEDVRCERSKCHLCLQVPDPFWRRQINWVWFDLWFCGECKEIRTKIQAHQGIFSSFACLICVCVDTGHVLGVVVVFILCSSLFYLSPITIDCSAISHSFFELMLMLIKFFLSVIWSHCANYATVVSHPMPFWFRSLSNTALNAMEGKNDLNLFA